MENEYTKQFGNGIRTWREALLNVTKDTVCRGRNNVYGEPEDVFAMIAEFWSAYLEKDISAYDVALMMILFKVARGKAAPEHIDNLTDIAGYAACAADTAASLNYYQNERKGVDDGENSEIWRTSIV